MPRLLPLLFLGRAAAATSRHSTTDIQICFPEQVPSFYHHPPGASCWQPETCPPGQPILQSWMSPTLRPLLRRDFSAEMMASLWLLASWPDEAG